MWQTAWPPERPNVLRVPKIFARNVDGPLWVRCNCTTHHTCKDDAAAAQLQSQDLGSLAARTHIRCSPTSSTWYDASYSVTYATALLRSFRAAARKNVSSSRSLPLPSCFCVSNERYAGAA